MLVQKGNKVFIRLLTIEDVGFDYLNWMLDPEVNQFLESRNTTFTIENLRIFVEKMNADDKNYLFGIFELESDKHIGNIKIGNISKVNNRADVGLIIGDKSFWGQGIATDAIALVTTFAFKKLKLNKLFAGMYVTNIGSFKAFIKAGYSKVAHFRNHTYCAGNYVDSIIVDIIKLDFENNKFYEKYSNNNG